MAFHHTSRLIRLDGRSTLSAECRDRDGAYHPATLNLDRCLGNDNGSFAWGGVNFSHSARNVNLLFPLLTAELRDTHGRWRDTEVDLAPRIENVNGALRYEWGGAVGSALDEAADGLQRMIFNPLERTFSDLLGLGGDGDDEDARPHRQQAPAREMDPRARPDTPRAAAAPQHRAPAAEAEAHAYAHEGDIYGHEAPPRPQPIQMQDLEPMPAADIGERILHFLLSDSLSANLSSVRAVRTVKQPDGGVIIELENEDGLHEEHPLSVDKLRSLKAEQDAPRTARREQVFFDFDDHVSQRAAAGNGEGSSRSRAVPSEVQELEGRKKGAAEDREVSDKEDEAELRRELESVDTGSHLHTPDFSDGEDDWLVAK